MAKTYLAANPTHKLLILDQQSRIGGFWAANSAPPLSLPLLGTFELSDFPLSSPTLKPNDLIPANEIQSYLSRLAAHYALTPRISLQHRVHYATRQADDTWSLSITDLPRAVTKNLKTRRLILATSPASVPMSPPSLRGTSDFNKPIFHTSAFASHPPPSLSPEPIAVLGCFRDAWPVVAAYASSGKPVYWILGRNAKPDAWIAARVGPRGADAEDLAMTRGAGNFSPCLWRQADGYEHKPARSQSGIGKWATGKVWDGVAKDVAAAYEGDPDLEKLRPQYPPFWTGAPPVEAGCIPALVKAGTIRVFDTYAVGLSQGTIHLAAHAGAVPISAVCYAGTTGGLNIPFSPSPTSRTLGIPFRGPAPRTEMHSTLDTTLKSRFPSLIATCPAPPPPTHESTKSWSLFRFVVPAGTSPSVAFVGMVGVARESVVAEAQALWVTAWFDNTEFVGMREHQRREEAALWARFGVWRYPGSGAGREQRVPEFYANTLAYVERLLGDVGVRTRRKGGFAEVTEAYGPKDYKGVLEEFLAVREKRMKRRKSQ
ncbi:hypothetical protein EJ06DRAFT_584674 [Trichodelitschia bisporula]|uniref:FAD/NAD(P)-binding domain-containing protein n=1 Tax=Trichodelitschia bisporula TaxID=703511 RepID=A0A6G1HMY5_9PEZI|nr:hypothetical protein EJ06DRAFT_584674 [Trichodelitschia bisporula]